MTLHEEVMQRFPVRKTAAQKEVFCQWAMEHAAALGYTAQVEEAGDRYQSRNVVFGDPEQAQVIVSAHYDTPAVMLLPNMLLPANRLAYFTCQMLSVGLMLLVCGMVYGISRWIGLEAEQGLRLCVIVYWALLLMMLFGPANRSNANDNTSGVAAVLQLMAQITPQQRSKVAFLLFDNEEKGAKGAYAYAKAHPSIRQEKLLINLDCVGVGENILILAQKKTRLMPSYERLRQAMQPREGKVCHFLPMEKCVFPSDQKRFEQGVAVCACKNGRWGFYCGRLHTSRDTLCDQQCLDALTAGLTDFITTCKGEQS